VEHDGMPEPNVRQAVPLLGVSNIEGSVRYYVSPVCEYRLS
jgi:hypothetical protein